MKIPPLILICLLPSCALITTPVKVAGAAASTTIKTTGSLIGAGAKAITNGNKDNEKEED